MFAQIIVESSQCLEPSFTSKYVVPIMPYFEIFYYLCTFGLLIVAIIGLKQIVMGRRIAKVNAKRDALKVSAEQCRLYADKIIPLADSFSENTKGFGFFESFEVSVNGSVISVKKTKKIDQESFNKMKEFFPDFVRLFNAIESFSQYLISRLADEKNAYICLGDVHVSIVKHLIPLLVLQDETGRNWQNTAILFVHWYTRQQYEKIGLEQDSLLQQLNSLDKKKELYDNANEISILDIDTYCK